MQSRTWMIVSGIVLIAGGVLALLLPGLASLTATLIVGWALILAGAFHLVQAVGDTDNRFWNAGFGLLGLILGLSFLFDPLGGAISLALFLGAAFFASGLMQLYLAWTRRATDSVWMMALSGIVSIGLALLIAFNLFAAAVTVPGIILAIELMTTGAALLLLRPVKAKAALSDTASRKGTHANAT